MNARLPLIAALAVALAPLDASAQAWLGSADFSEGAGIRAGNFELHPSIGAEFGYDSNFTRASAAEGPVDVMKLRITPSITLSSLGKARRNSDTPPNVVFNAGAHASYFELFPLDSGESEVRKRRNVGAGVDAKVDVFPFRKVGFDLLAGFRRVIQAEGRSEDLAGEGFNRDTLRYGGGVTWRPGGGLFDWRGGYTGTFNHFENAAYSSLQNVHHDFNTRGRWRFLPRTALLFDTSYVLVRYTRDTVQTDGDLLRSRVGFHGLVTYHLAILGMMGWASTFYRSHDGSIEPRQYDGPIANAELRWFIQPRPDLEKATIATGLSSVAVGYARTVNNSYLGSFYTRDRGYLQFSAFVLGAIAGGLEFGVSRVAFPDARGGGGTAIPSFSQLRLDAGAFGEYRFTDTLAANATFVYDQVNSESIPNEDLDYKRWQAYLGLRWFM